MKVAISSLSSRDDSLIGKIKKILDDENINSEIIKRSDKMTTSIVDIVITAGGDRAILDYSHYDKELYVTVLGKLGSTSCRKDVCLNDELLWVAVTKIKKQKQQK